MTLYLIFLMALAVPSAGSAGSTAGAASDARGASSVAYYVDDSSVREVAHSLCDKQVAMLGENGFHGDGKTVAFKAALIQRLVSKCHFSAVMFESSHYDFLAITRKMREGETVTADMLSSAIGQIWNRDEELAPLIPFLLTQMKSGNVAVSGLDDQMGIRGAFYSNEQMPTELTSYLRDPRREACHEALRKRIFYDYSADTPYSLDDRTRIRQCLRDIKDMIGKTARVAPKTRDELLQMIANIERSVARDFGTDEERIWGRDRSMYDNFQWLVGQQAGRPKVIIWAANDHIARDANSSPSYTGGGRTLGSYVGEAYGKRAFALGFSAAGGTYRWSSREVRAIPVAPAGSLEALAITGTWRDPTFLNPQRIMALGTLPGALFGHRYLAAPWHDVIDGAVIFRSERPPYRSDIVR